jgi:cytochrome c peroxidase
MALVALGAVYLWQDRVRSSALEAGPAPVYVPPATDHPVSPIPSASELGLDPRKVVLGKRLFQDVRLSQDDTISCASCHRLTHSGEDGRPVAVGIQGRLGALNSPTVFNAGFNFRQFWDGRAGTLEEQAQGPIHNPAEMASNWQEVLAKLGRDAAYVNAFKAIWPVGMTAETISSALAEFQRSLTTPDSRFDRYLRGETAALDGQARRGWDLFRNLGCIACHQGVNLGGNMYASLGVMGDYFADRGKPVAKEDLGRFNVTGREVDRHVFKVPSLRNVARTAPYFHDGSLPNLEKAVVTMARYQLGVQLSSQDSQDLIAFLNSLDGRRPESLQ